MLNRKHIAVIGGGWAGCAAALALAQRGAQVTLFESNRQLGGRARSVALHGHMLDNGQHILLGAYSACLQVMRDAGLVPEQHLLYLPLQMPYPLGTGMQFIAPTLPAPLHLLIALLRAKGLSSVDKLALARFSTIARWQGWRLPVDCSVTALLTRFRQSPNLVKLLWRPLCLAALNTPPERASAQVFLAVLRDSLGAKRAASDMLLPKTDLSTLFPTAAAQRLRNLGTEVHCGTTVSRVLRDGAQWRVQCRTGDTTQEDVAYDGLIIATTASAAAKLLHEHGVDLPEFTYESITTCYLQYSSDVSLTRPMFALVDEPELQHWGQFVFDRGQLHAGQAGLLAVIISAASAASEMPQEILAQQIAQQLATIFQRPELLNPQWSQVITEKRATFACELGLQRPENRTKLPGLYLAGDYTKGEYPATLEGAVRSGLASAALCLK